MPLQIQNAAKPPTPQKCPTHIKERRYPPEGYQIMNTNARMVVQPNRKQNIGNPTRITSNSLHTAWPTALPPSNLPVWPASVPTNNQLAAMAQASAPPVIEAQADPPMQNPAPLPQDNANNKLENGPVFKEDQAQADTAQNDTQEETLNNPVDQCALDSTPVHTPYEEPVPSPIHIDDAGLGPTPCQEGQTEQADDWQPCDYTQEETLYYEEGIPFGKGLLQYQKWWYLNPVDVRVNGETVSGIPIFLQENTLRVVNDAYSYFIPLENVDYIRTRNGLRC